MKLCKHHGLGFADSYEDRFIMKRDDNGKPCEVKDETRRQCNIKSVFTVITP